MGKVVRIFLKGVYVSAKQAINATYQINTLFEKDFITIAKLGRVRFACEQVLH